MDRRKFLTTAGLGSIALSIRAQNIGAITMSNFKDFTEKKMELTLLRNQMSPNGGKTIKHH